MLTKNRTITCSNETGTSICFTEKAFSPFLLTNADGVYTQSNSLTISQNTMSDGGEYQGSVVKVRNIVLTLADKEDHAYNRNLLSALFNRSEVGTLVYNDGVNERECKYYVESLTQSQSGGVVYSTISLQCPDPFFYNMTNETVAMASWESAFYFTHEFTDADEELGYRSSIRSQNIRNESADSDIGMTIEIKATGSVSNPTISHVESDEHITIGSDSNPFTMVAGDILTITTGNGDKHVYKTHEDTTTEVNQYLTEDSEFIQLQRGDNNIGYSADSGVDNLVVEITYRLKFAGA